MIPPLLILGKLIYFFSNLLNIGSGGTWPGEVALFFNPPIFSYLANKVKKGIILVVGTNGKTTTAKMIVQILTSANLTDLPVIHNESGANLLNGLVSAFIKNTSWTGKMETDFAVLEVDENTVPIAISNIKYQIPARNASHIEAGGSKTQIKNQKLIVLLLNLFRDQLDRYGEVDLIASKWEKALKHLPINSTVILNADDPQIAFIGKNLKAKTLYFGINKPEKFIKKIEHATDSTYCRSCDSKLEYKGIYFSHLGIWYCPKCNNRRPKIDSSQWEEVLPGLYNEYNVNAAAMAAKALGINESLVKKALQKFSPAFGRQEEFEVKGKRLKIFLSKNPAGFNASLRTVIEMGAKELLLVLNDRIPDGRDVSWIWDVDFEMIPNDVEILLSGDRAYDLGVRIKYSRKIQNSKSKMQNYLPAMLAQALQAGNSKLKFIENLKEAIFIGLKGIQEGETLYILPTYTAMLEVRKILRGRKIL